MSQSPLAWGILIGAALAALFLYVRFRPAARPAGSAAPGSTADPDSLPMPLERRRVLVFFLSLLACALFYLLASLWSLDFAEPRPSLSRPPILAAAGAPADPAQPAIEKLNPDEISSASAPPILTVYGYNFSERARVFVNTAERPPRYLNPNTLLVPLAAADVAQPGPVVVTVVEGARSSNPALLPVRQALRLGRLRLPFAEFRIDEETRLLLLALAAGSLGAYVHAIKSLADYIGNRTLTASWFWFYITRPFVGTALALVFYAVIRGGFLVGTPAETSAVNPFGVVAISGLVGMFADKAANKLSEVFDALFRTDDARADKLAPLEITTEALGDAALGNPYDQPLAARGGQSPYFWSASGLPQGLSVNPALGALSGAAAADGTFAVTLSVKDSADATRSKQLPLRVEPRAGSASTAAGS
ncbi:MAG: hypothetical protein FJW37_10220 [Acidobacteria bacterium]|nr:hypothetical protein [Acidobacteriota bacterium]